MMEKRSDCKTGVSSSIDTANQRINKFLNKFMVWIVGVSVALGAGIWNRMESRVDSLEDRVAFLNQDKVSRKELKDEMSLMRQSIDKSNLELLSRQEQMKGDILSRVELILKFLGPQNNNKQ